jgi:hypothetical protein
MGSTWREQLNEVIEFWPDVPSLGLTDTVRD